ncbi:MAG TPA: hypothetical protein VGX92_02305 [Pyrinomonadaceae bacterium]|jgi:hypothetical protein|nr:hypothetical protein [Pyrinomonadaceae bacterium]
MKYILVLLAGLVLGGVLVFFLFVGAPHAGALPGAPLKPPDQGGDPPGTAMITLDERFFDAVLATIFRDMNAPSFPLQFSSLRREGDASGDPFAPDFRRAVFQGDCASAVTLVPEGSNVRTGVRLADGKIVSPLAFSGSFNAPIFGCMRFKGWAQASIQLSFDQSKQMVYGRINVEGVNLDNTASGVGDVVTALVQRAINERVNPLEILQSHQLTLSLPVKASNSTLKAQVKDVREEIQNGKLTLHITYDFTGQKQGG